MTDDRYDAEALARFAAAVLRAAGLTDDHATVVADALVRANLRGVDSHGVIRLQPYAKRVAAGGMNGDPEIAVRRTGASTLRIDADDGPGQSATAEAMDAAVERAAETGVGLATVENSNHFGTAAYYTMRAAEAGCIGIAMTNVGSNVVPFGGTEPFFGTNPLSYSIPTPREFDVTLDMATSVVAKGKVYVAQDEDESIPDSWAVDAAGDPTTDPDEVAALRPVGGAKGYGLGLLVDVCSGLLSGMGPSPSVDSLYDDYATPQRVGHFVGAVDVGAFRDPDAFAADMDRLVDDLKAVPPADGVDEVKLPGEPEFEVRRRREREGVPLPASTAADLRDLGSEYGVGFPEPC